MNDSGDSAEDYLRERWRQERERAHAALLDCLKHALEQGYRRVEWVSAGHAECYLCRKRNGKVFTIAAARKLLDKHYCRASDGGHLTGCRCLIRGVLEERSENEPADSLSGLGPYAFTAITRELPDGSISEQVRVGASPEAVNARLDVAAAQAMRALVQGIERVDDPTAARAVLADPRALDGLRSRMDSETWANFHAALQRISARPPKPPPDAAAAIDRENAKAREREVAEESDLDRARRFLT